MPVSLCRHCGAPNHHSGGSFRVECHNCERPFAIPQPDRRAAE